MADNKDQVTVDLTNYKDKVGSRVTPGRYRVVVEDAEPDKSNQGNQMINLWLRIVGGEFDGLTIVDRLVLTEKSLFRVVGFMQALGLPTPKKRLNVNLATWRGKALMIDVEDGDPYNGRIKSEVRGYEKSRSGAAMANVDNAAADELAGPGAADPVTSDLGGLDEFRPAQGDLRDGIPGDPEGSDGDDGAPDPISGLDEVDLDDLKL